MLLHVAGEAQAPRAVKQTTSRSCSGSGGEVSMDCERSCDAHQTNRSFRHRSTDDSMQQRRHTRGQKIKIMARGRRAALVLAGAAETRRRSGGAGRGCRINQAHNLAVHAGSQNKRF